MYSLFLLGLLTGGVITAAIFIGTEKAMERRKPQPSAIVAHQKFTPVRS